MATYKIYWKNIEIGSFKENTFDMGYLDGYFSRNASEAATEFVLRASQLKVKDVMIDPTKGIRAILKDNEARDFTILILGLSNNLELFLKLILGKQEDIEWFIANVPEE